MTAFDFLGMGQSGTLSSPFSVSDYAEWTKAVLERLEIENPMLVAHSFGVRVAVKLANDVAFQKMVFTGPAGVLRKRSPLYHLKVGAYKCTKKLFPKYAERHFGSKEYKTLSPVMKESYKKIVNEDLLPFAKTIRCPVLILEGTKDKTTPLCEAEAYAQTIKRSKLCKMDGGHFLFLEHPLAFNLAVEEFMNE